MSESQSAVATTAPAATVATETAPVAEAKTEPVATKRFRSMRLPSGPFWLTLLAGVIAVTLIVVSWSTVFIFAIGVVIAFFVLPLVDWMVRTGRMGRTAASGVVVLALVGVFILLLLVGLAILVNQAIPFVASIPGYLQDFAARLEALNLPDWVESSVDTASAGLSTAVQTVDVGAFVLGFFQGIFGLVGTLLSLMVLPFFLFYFLRDQPKMAQDFYERVPNPWRAHVEAVIHTFKDDFADYFKAELVVGSIMGVIVTVGMLVIGWIVGGPLGNYALMLGLIAAVMELLPTIGPILSMIPALIIALGTSPVAFVLVLVFYLIAFQVEGSILVPNLEGKVIDFGPATVLFLIALGFGVGGILGAIVILPLAAIARDLFSYFFHQIEQQSLAAASSAEPD